jgi:hypothetical protein
MTSADSSCCLKCSNVPPGASNVSGARSGESNLCERIFDVRFFQTTAGCGRLCQEVSRVWLHLSVSAWFRREGGGGTVGIVARRAPAPDSPAAGGAPRRTTGACTRACTAPCRACACASSLRCDFAASNSVRVLVGSLCGSRCTPLRPVLADAVEWRVFNSLCAGVFLAGIELASVACHSGC